MKVRDLLGALQQIKKHRPVFDVNEFDITAGGENIVGIEVKEGFVINIRLPDRETKDESSE